MPAVPHTADMLGALHTVEMRDAKSKCRKKVFQTGAVIARRTHCNVHKKKQKKKPGTAAGLFDEYFFRSVHFASFAI
jgi:hypothetical protein